MNKGNVGLLFEIYVDVVVKAVKRLEIGKAPGVDGTTSEMLQYGGEWLSS